MSGRSLLVLIVINILQYPNSQTVTYYKILGYNTQTFPINWAESLTFIPKYIYVKYLIEDDKSREDNNPVPIEFNAELCEGTCSGSALPFPDISTKEGERMRGLISINYYSDRIGLEKFEFYAWRGFTPGIKLIYGLQNRASLPIDFNPSLKSLPKYEWSPSHYFQKMPALGTAQRYCLQIFDNKQDIKLKLIGDHFEKNGARDHYSLSLVALSEDGSQISQLKYLAKTTICSEGRNFLSTKIVVDKTVTKFLITIDEYTGLESLACVYEKVGGLLKVKPDISEFQIEKLMPYYVSIAAVYPRSFRLYPTDLERTECRLVDEFSFVEKEVYQKLAIGYNTAYGDHSTDGEKILRMRPATRREIEKCLKK